MKIKPRKCLHCGDEWAAPKRSRSLFCPLPECQEAKDQQKEFEMKGGRSRQSVDNKSYRVATDWRKTGKCKTCGKVRKLQTFGDCTPCWDAIVRGNRLAVDDWVYV